MNLLPRSSRSLKILLLLGLALGLTTFYALTHTTRFQPVIAAAKEEMKSGQYEQASQRLINAWNRKAFWIAEDPTGGELFFQQAYALSKLNRTPEAIQTLKRIWPGSAYYMQAMLFSADLNLEQGHWREAENLAAQVLSESMNEPVDQKLRIEAMKLLDRYYRMQCRFQDAAQILEQQIRESNIDTIRLLKDHWRTSRGTPPLDLIEQSIKTGESLDSSDSRIWLAKANLALMKADTKAADAALSICEKPANDPDNAVYLARMKWSQMVNQPDRCAEAALKLKWAGLPMAIASEWTAYLAEAAGDEKLNREALEAGYNNSNRDTRLLSQYAAYLEQKGEHKKANKIRSEKGEVDKALQQYNKLMSDVSKPETADDMVQWAKLAFTCGLWTDYLALQQLALKLDPDSISKFNPIVPDTQATSVVNNQAELGPPYLCLTWSTLAEKLKQTKSGNDSKDTTLPITPQFNDLANTSGHRFQFRNGETEIRQMPVALSGGVALIDYDNDGWEDVFVVQGGAFPFNPSQARSESGDRLFKNMRKGQFKDVTELAGLPPHQVGYGQGVCVGDVNNDGFSDLFVTRYGSYQLYLNSGKGKFVDSTAQWKLDGDRDWPTSAAFADLDNDGDLDLYVCHYVVWDEKNPRLCRNARTSAYMSCNPTTCDARADHLFRNDGSSFTDISEAAGIKSADRDGRGLGVVAADFDDDGRTDIFVANDKSANYLFQNKGDMKFEEVAHLAGVAGSAEGSYQAGMGVACGDYDGDNRLDLAVTNYYGESTSIYQNLGGFVFTDRTQASGVASATRLRLGFGTAFMDANNDGYPDLFTANGHTDDMGDVPYRMPAQLLIGSKNHRFTDATENAGKSISIPHLGRGLTVGDLDLDGRMDALLLPQNEPLVYFHNETAGKNHWISIRLEGKQSNRDGVGAKVKLTSSGRTQYTQRFGGGSYQSAISGRLHFGLGQSGTIDLIEIRWPSGQVDRHLNVKADRLITLVEGATSILPVQVQPNSDNTHTDSPLSSKP